MPSPSGVNALLALAAASPAIHTHGGTATDADDAAPDQAFSQLLSDFGAHADGKDAQNFSRGSLLIAGAGGAVNAQEIDLKGLLAQAQAGSPGDLVVTPENAAALLQRLDALAAQLVQAAQGKQGEAAATAHTELLQQIKDQLQLVAHSDTPKPLSDIVAALPAAKDTPLIPLLVAALQDTKRISERNSERKMLDAAAAAEEVPTESLAAMQAMSAMMFRPVVAENQPQAPAAPEQKKKPRDFVETVTIIEPVAFTTTIAVTDSKADAASAIKVPRADLDQLVPPLTRDERTHLPEVTLPNMAAAQADNAAARAAIKGDNAFADALGDAKAMRHANAVDAASTMDALYPTHGVSGHTTATHAASMKSVDLVATAGLLNHAPVTEQVHVAIHQAAKDGTDRITIQLDPVDLGRVEVHMHTNKEGHTQLVFTVDKPETFDGLSRDARMLERSLQEAGIKADTGSMQFNLRQQPQPNLQSGLGGQGQPQQQTPTAPDDENAQHTSITGVQPSAVLARNYILNIREGVDISA